MIQFSRDRGDELRIGCGVTFEADEANLLMGLELKDKDLSMIDSEITHG